MKLKERIYRSLMSGEFIRNILLFIPRLVSRAIEKMDLYIRAAARIIYGKNVKVQNNKIFFINFQGAYTCNQAAIAEEILKQELPYELVFTVNEENKKNINIMKEFPLDVKLVERGTYEFYNEAASSKVLIDNSTSLAYLGVRKKPEQVWIQTWHGALGIKKATKDVIKDKRWIRKATRSGKKTDYCISNSKFETDLVYKPSYWKDCEILEYGHPRNDIFFDEDKLQKAEAKVRKHFNIADNKKILLYAPTFRDNRDLKYYDIDFERLKSTLEEKFGGEWVILFRLHFRFRQFIEKIELIDGIINATDYCDIQELIAACDIGITDYSSWIYDMVLTNKFGFIYAIDMDSYDQERGLFFPLSETPFSLATNNDELVNNIMNFNPELYEEKRIKFIEARGSVEDGNASKRVVNKIKEIVKASDGTSE